MKDDLDVNDLVEFCQIQLNKSAIADTHSKTSNLFLGENFFGNLIPWILLFFYNSERDILPLDGSLRSQSWLCLNQAIFLDSIPEKNNTELESGITRLHHTLLPMRSDPDSLIAE